MIVNLDSEPCPLQSHERLFMMQGIRRGDDHRIKGDIEQRFNRRKCR